MVERENIFSWRGQLREMNSQQRVDFYYQKLQEDYRESVFEAEIARQSSRKPNDSHDEEIQALFETWASEGTQRVLNTALERRRKRGLNVEESQKIVDLGLAGHFRIKQVHETIIAERCPWWEEAEKRKTLTMAGNVFKRWPSVERTTSTTPYTIHGGAIDWELEVIQDKVKYWHAVGRDDGAVRIAERGISLGLRKIGGWLLENLPNRPDIVATNIDLWLKDVKEEVGIPQDKLRELLGVLSSIAVLEYRKGLYSQELGPLIGALRDISAVQEVAPNNHRFATVNWHVLFASLVYKGNYSLKERVGWFIKAIKNLIKTGKQDPKSVIRSFLQMI